MENNAGKTGHVFVPEELKNYVELETCQDFNPNRYYVTRAVSDITGAIINNMNLAAKLRAYNVDYVNTVLLYGPPGTGKTTFARFLAFYLEKELIYVNFAGLMDGGYGNTEKNLKSVFRTFTSQDCIFFIDEIDCIATDRTESSNDTMKSITVTLMQELDHCKKAAPKAIILAATNVYTVLDAALLSRFTLKKQIPVLSNEDKLAFVIKYLKDLDVPYDREQLEEYVARSSRVPQRNMEQDIIRALATWIENGENDDEPVVVERMLEDN